MDNCTCTKLIHDVAFIETINFLKLYSIPFVSQYRCSATSYIRFLNALEITSKSSINRKAVSIYQISSCTSLLLKAEMAHKC